MNPAPYGLVHLREIRRYTFYAPAKALWLAMSLAADSSELCLA